MDLEGKQVLVFGAGRSGVAASLLLLECGASPVLYDGNESLDEAEVRRQFRMAAQTFSFPQPLRV